MQPRAGVRLQACVLACLRVPARVRARGCTRARARRTAQAKFAPRGYSAAAMYCCYGLAEATLLVCGIDRSDEPTRIAVDRSALQANARPTASRPLDAPALTFLFVL